MRIGMGMRLNQRQAGGGNPDGLSLDLAFAADKTLVARKGPTPSFTRTQTSPTGSTYIGADGLIKYAAANEPRFDHDPSTGVCRGLLIEESRQNALLNSDALATQNVTVTAAARTLSFYGTGTVVLSGAHVATVVGTGAFPARTTLTFTPTAGTLTLTVTGTVQFAQLEIGAFPTSYIPTTTAPLTRSADVCSITGDAFTSFYNNSAGTLLSEAMVANLVGNNRGIVQIDSGTNESHLRHGYAILNGGFFGSIRASADTQTTLSVVAGTASTIQKRAIAYEGTSFASTSNGEVVATTTRTMPVGLNAMRIGDLTSGSFQLNGHIARIQYFKKRLPNAKLQTLTTP